MFRREISIFRIVIKKLKLFKRGIEETFLFIYYLFKWDIRNVNSYKWDIRNINSPHVLTLQNMCAFQKDI